MSGQPPVWKKYTQMTFKIGSGSPNHSQIFASCHLCKLVQDYYKYRNNYNIIRCENYSNQRQQGERGGSVVECRTPEREVGGSRPTAAVLCPWARHFTPRKYWLITQEAMAPSRHDWKIVDWDVKPQHNQPTNANSNVDVIACFM